MALQARQQGHSQEKLHVNAEEMVRHIAAMKQLVARLAGLLAGPLPNSLSAHKTAGAMRPTHHHHSLMDPVVTHSLAREYHGGDSMRLVGDTLEGLVLSCDRLVSAAVPLAVESAHAGNRWLSASKDLEVRGCLIDQASASIEWLTETNAELRKQLDSKEKHLVEQQRAFTQWAVRGANKASVDSISGALWYREEQQSLRVTGSNTKAQSSLPAVEWRAVLSQMQRSLDMLRAERDDCAAKFARLSSHHHVSMPPPSGPSREDALEAEVERLRRQVSDTEEKAAEVRSHSDRRILELEVQVAAKKEELEVLRNSLSNPPITPTTCHSRNRSLVAALHLSCQRALAHKYTRLWCVFAAHRRATKEATLTRYKEGGVSGSLLPRSDSSTARHGVEAETLQQQDNTWEVAELLVRLGKQHTMLIALEDERDALAAENAELHESGAGVGAATVRSRLSTPQSRPTSRVQVSSLSRLSPLRSFKGNPRPLVPLGKSSALNVSGVSTVYEDGDQQQLPTTEEAGPHQDEMNTLSTLSVAALRALISDHPDLFVDERSRLSNQKVHTLEDASNGNVASESGAVRKAPRGGGKHQVTATQVELTSGGAGVVTRAIAAVGGRVVGDGRTLSSRAWVESLLRPSGAAPQHTKKAPPRPLEILSAIEREVEQLNTADIEEREERASKVQRFGRQDTTAKRKAMLHKQLVLASNASLDSSNAILMPTNKSSTGHQPADDDVTAIKINPLGADGLVHPGAEVTLEAVQVRSLKLYSVLQPLLGVLQRRLGITNCPLAPLPLFEATTKPIVTVVLHWAHSNVAQLLQLLTFEDRLTHCKLRLYFLSAQLRRRARELEGDLATLRAEHRARAALDQQLVEYRRLLRAVAAERAHIDSLKVDWKGSDIGATKDRQEAVRLQKQRMIEEVEMTTAGFIRQMEANVASAYLLRSETADLRDASSKSFVEQEAARRIAARELRLTVGHSKETAALLRSPTRSTQHTKDPDVEGRIEAVGGSSASPSVMRPLLPPLQLLDKPKDGNPSDITLIDELQALKSQVERSRLVTPSSQPVNFHTGLKAGGRMTPMQKEAALAGQHRKRLHSSHKPNNQQFVSQKST